MTVFLGATLSFVLKNINNLPNDFKNRYNVLIDIFLAVMIVADNVGNIQKFGIYNGFLYLIYGTPFI